MIKGLILPFLALLACNAYADSFRCDGGIIKSGDSVNLLKKKCGSPQRTCRTYETINKHGHRKSNLYDSREKARYIQLKRQMKI